MSIGFNYESFCLDPAENLIFAGNALGQISSIDIDSFSVISEIQAHNGIVQAMAAHPTLPYVTSLSTDRTVSVWKKKGHELSLLCSIPLRGIKPSNDTECVPFVHSTSQALGFHDLKPRLVTRSANAGVVELEFDSDGEYRVCWCQRLHGDADLISIRFVKDRDDVLSGSIDGLFILSLHGKELRRWQIGKSGNVHWAEYLEDETYLIASDMRAVARVNIDNREPIVVGQPFTRDDLEHVTYNQVSRRAFVASFDRTIYEIDPRTCMPVRVAFRPPFKCRWLKTLKRSPSTLIVQCRNGGLYKANSDTGENLGVIKRTPFALWTAVHLQNGSLLFSGEGEFLLHFQPMGLDEVSLAVEFAVRKIPLPVRVHSYTKRMVLQSSMDRLIMGRTDGDVFVVSVDPDGNVQDCKFLRNMKSAVRDLAADPNGSTLFAACEDGHVHRIDLDSGEIILSWKSPVNQPIWSLAHCPERAILAASERGGRMFVLDDANFRVLFDAVETGRPKRMKFIDGQTLLYNKLDQLHRLDLVTGRSSLLVDSQGNTIEDFIWDRDGRYLLLIGYMQNIVLCDLQSGEVLNVVPDQIGYSKGLIWVDRKQHDFCNPLDFLTFGRSGTAHYFRVHDEKIVALGPIRHDHSDNH